MLRRACRLSMEFATAKKGHEIGRLLEAYRGAVNFYVRSLWQHPGALDKRTLARLPAEHTRLQSMQKDQALAMVSSTCEDINISLTRFASHLSRDAIARMELPMFPKNRPGRIIWHDLVPVAGFALALLLTLWTYEYSDLLPKWLPTQWSIEHGVASYQRERTDIRKHGQWTTVWPTVVRFDRPVI
jgi:hypothetical protein